MRCSGRLPAQAQILFSRSKSRGSIRKKKPELAIMTYLHYLPPPAGEIDNKKSKTCPFQQQFFTRNTPFYFEKVFCFNYRSYFCVIINKQIFLEMAYVISDDCISCGTCEGECPVGAISMGADHYEIDPNACTDCGTCAGVCPVEAIKQA